MFENSNKAVMWEIGKKSMQSHRLRNSMAILAIALTTLLITTIFTIGFCFFDTIERGTETTPGPLADGGVIASLSAYNEIQNMEQIQWAAYVRPCNLGSLHNREMIGINAVLLAPNNEFYMHNKVELAVGSFPKNADEIAVSTTMAKRLGIGMKAGASYILNPVIPENGRQEEKAIPVTITGIYTSPIEPLSSIYEEIYTSESFLTAYAPEMENAAATIYIRFQDMTDQSLARASLDEINAQVGGERVVYRIPQTVSALHYLVLLAPLALIMFSGYTLIYNVFYIFIINDVRFYGLLKTIGASGRQIKSLLTWQTARLAAAGIGIGIVLGYAVGIVAVPVVLSFTDWGDFFRFTVDPSIFLFAAFFSIITVIISCRKPYRAAIRISPVEASKYGEKNSWRKKILSAVSFALSSIIFLVVFTATLGYDVETMVKRYNTADVRIIQQAMLYGNEESYMPVSEDMIAALNLLPFVQDIKLYYQARQLNYTEEGCEPATGQIKMIDSLRSDYNRCIEQEFGWISPVENGDIKLAIQGLPATELHLEDPNIRVLEGSLDEEAFASGGYLVYNQGTYQTGRLTPNGIRTGDRLSLSFYDLDEQQYVDKTLEVLAVVERVNPFPTGIMAKSAFSLSDSDFKDIYPSAGQMISIVQINSKKELTETQYKMIEHTVQGSFNAQLNINSRFSYREEFQSRKIGMTLLGLFISGIFGLIGLSNIVNTLVTDIISRKMEYAAMQSIGMTKRQMMKDIQRRSMILCGIGIALAIPFGILLTQNFTKILFSLSGFSLPFYLIGCILLLGIMAGISTGIAFILTRYLNRKPVIERLREAE